MKTIIDQNYKWDSENYDDNLPEFQFYFEKLFHEDKPELVLEISNSKKHRLSFLSSPNNLEVSLSFEMIERLYSKIQKYKTEKTKSEIESEKIKQTQEYKDYIQSLFGTEDGN